MKRRKTVEKKDDQNIIIINQEIKDTIENKNLLESDDEENKL